MGDRRGVVAAVAAGLLAIGAPARAQTGANVLVVVNTTSSASETIGRQYAAQRGVPQDNLCAIQAPASQMVSRSAYNAQIEQPIWMCISTRQAHDRILYIVLTKDVPIRIAGTDGRTGTASSVDSELTLLYRRRSGRKSPVSGFVPNPYFTEAAPIADLKPFCHETHDIRHLSSGSVRLQPDQMRIKKPPRRMGRVFSSSAIYDAGILEIASVSGPSSSS